MIKTYEVLVDFYSENVTSSNITKNAEDLGIWFNNTDINSSYIKASFDNDIDLSNYDIAVNWQLTNREKRIQEMGITKSEDMHSATIKVPSEAINGGKGKLYFNVTLKNRNTNETLNSSSFIITITNSLKNTAVVDDKLISEVKNAEMFNGKNYDEVTIDIAKKIGDLNTEGLATEEFVDEKVKDFITEEKVDEKLENIDLSGYVLNEDLADVAKTGNYEDLKNKPVVKFENQTVNINDLDVGVYTLVNCDFVYGPNNTAHLGRDTTSTVFIYNNSDIKSFIIIANYGTYSTIAYNLGENLKQINLSKIAVKDDLTSFVDIEDVNGAIDEKINGLNFDDVSNAVLGQSKEYTDEKIKETKKDIDDNNITFRNTIYQTIIDTFAKVPDTYLGNYATKAYVVEEIAKAVSGVSGGLTESQINALIDEKLKAFDGGNVDLTDYYTKAEVDEKVEGIDLTNYLTIEAGDKRYMTANTTIDNKKPAYGEYKTLLKGPMFRKYHEIVDFWPNNESNSHEERRKIEIIRKIPSTDLYIAYINNNYSGVEKGFSIFHFLSNKTIEEDTYITISSLNLGIKDYTDHIRIFISEDKPLISVLYFTSNNEAHAALLSIDTENKTINVDDDIVLRDSTTNVWLCELDGQYNRFSANICDDFSRIAMVFDYKTTSATNIVVMDISLNNEGKYKYINKNEFISYYDGNYVDANICFIDNDTFTIGKIHANYLYVCTYDGENGALDLNTYTFPDLNQISGIYKIGNYLFLYGMERYGIMMSAVKIEDDGTLTYLEKLALTSSKYRDETLRKYMPTLANNCSYGSTIPTFIVDNYTIENNKIILTTGCKYSVRFTQPGSICFNVLTEKFEYYYPNFSNYQRQLAGIIYTDDEKTRALGYIKNKLYFFNVTKDEPFVVQCGDNILYSYPTNQFNEDDQIIPAK